MAISTAQPPQGGSFGDGTIFSMTANGALATLHSLRWILTEAGPSRGALTEERGRQFLVAANAIGWNQ